MLSLAVLPGRAGNEIRLQVMLLDLGRQSQEESFRGICKAVQALMQREMDPEELQVGPPLSSQCHCMFQQGSKRAPGAEACITSGGQLVHSLVLCVRRSKRTA